MGNVKQYRDTDYIVSEHGEVFNKNTGIRLKPTIVKGGYERIHPHINGKHCNIFVNRMVAELFVPNPDNKPLVLHNDNNPRNNNASNLRWGTQSENIQQAYDQNRLSAKGQKNGQAKLTDEIVLKIRADKGKGKRVGVIAKEYSVSHSVISNICAGKTWRHI